MTRELGNVLLDAVDSTSRTIGAMAPASLDGVVRRVRRGRVVRHTVTAATATGAAAVLGTAGWFGLQARDAVPPAVTPSPSVTPSPNPSPNPSPSESPSQTPTPTETPEGPVVRETAVDDATVLERLSAPRTGETWTDPVLASDAPPLVDTEMLTTATTYRLGQRGDATIYAVVEPFEWIMDSASMRGLFEVDSAGARFISCPSARTGDLCVDPAAAFLAPGVTVDTDTFYDTLTMPQHVEVMNGYTLSTVATAALWTANHQQLGDGRTIVDTEGTPVTTETVLRRFGAGAVVELTSAGEVAGLTDVSYAWRTPYGSYHWLTGADVPAGNWNTLTWDDGVDRRLDVEDWGPALAGAAPVNAPGAPRCFAPMFSIDADHDDAAWRAAGRTADGLRVYVPVAGGNDLSRAVRAWHEAESWAITEDGELRGADAYALTGFTTDAKFLDANALFAVERPDGVWLLGLRPDAAQVVYECA